MSKIFKCIVCGLMGIVVGISATFGAMTVATYYAYGNVTVGGVTGDKYKAELGDLNSFSIEDFLGLAQKGKANPSNYTFRDLEKRYGFDLVGFINKLGGGKEPVIATDGSNDKYVEELKNVSPFTLLDGNGFQKFIDDLPFGAVLSFIPSSTLFTESERIKLRRYTVGDMLKKDPITGTTGVIEALRDVKVGGVIPALYSFDETTGKYKVKDGYYSGLDVIGNVALDSFINVVTGKTDWATEFTEGGLKEAGNTSIGDLVKRLGVSDNKITARIDAALSSLTVADILKKNYETGKYDLSIESLLGSLNVGGMLGYTYDGGKWYSDAEKTKPVTGLLAAISSFDMKQVYRALTSKEDWWEKIRQLTLVAEDLSVGDILETFGYKKDESGKWLKNGKEPKVKLLVALADTSLYDIFGGANKMTADDVRRKVAREIATRCYGMTFGEAFGELMSIKKSDDGSVYVWSTGKNAGKEVNRALGEFAFFRVDEVAELFAGEKIDKNKVEKTLLDLLDGVKVGYLCGATENGDGTWKDVDGVNPSKYARFYEVTLDKLVEPFLHGEKNVMRVLVDAFGEETTVGQLFAPMFGAKENPDGTINYDGSRLSESRYAADRFFSIKLSALKNAKDIPTVFNDAFKSITFGDAYGCRRDESGKWIGTDGTEQKFDGSFGDKILEKLLDKTLIELRKGIDFNEVTKDFYVGEIMEYKRCYVDADGNRVCDVPTHGATHADGWYDKTGKKVSVTEEKIADKTLGSLMSGGLDLAQTFKGEKLGEAMGYVKDGEVWKDGAGKPVTDPIFKRVNDLDLGDLLGGKIDFATTFDSLELGELMGYTKDGATWKDGAGNPVSGVTACIVGYTLADVKADGFTNKLTEKIKTTVKVKEILDFDATNPMSLVIDENTTIGEIPANMAKLNEKTLGDFFAVKVVNTNEEDLDNTFETILKAIGSPTLSTQFSDAVRAKAATAVAAGGTDKEKANRLWRSLTIDETVSCVVSMSNIVKGYV